jgi:hypothetical protein
MFIKYQNPESYQIYKILKEFNLPLEFYLNPSKGENLPKYKSEWTPMKNVLVLFNQEHLILVDIETMNFKLSEKQLTFKRECIPNIYKFNKCDSLVNLDQVKDFSLFRGRLYIENSRIELDIIDKYILFGYSIQNTPMKQRQEEYHDNRIYNFGIDVKFSKIVFLDSELETLYGISYYTQDGILIKNIRIDSTKENTKIKNFKPEKHLVEKPKLKNQEINSLNSLNLKEFELRSSSFPECYFLYSLDTKQKVGLALIDSYECSQWIKMLLNKENESKSKELSNKNALNETFRECSISTIIKIKCYFNKERSGWIPIKM